jgi:hypothetical protein
MEWSKAIFGAIHADRDARMDRLMNDPMQQLMMRRMRGMLEFEAANTPEPECFKLVYLVSGADRRFLEPALAYAAWSLKPDFFKVEAAQAFDMREIGDIPLFLKIFAEGSEDGYALRVVLPEVGITEQGQWVAAFQKLRRYGSFDLFVKWEEKEAVLTVNAGEGRLHFPKVNKALLSNICPACTKKNKEGAAKCFGCKRAL